MQFILSNRSCIVYNGVTKVIDADMWHILPCKHQDLNRRKYKMNKMDRREFLRSAGKAVLGAAALTAVPAVVSTAKADETIAAPAFPWTWPGLDVTEVQNKIYENFFAEVNVTPQEFERLISSLLSGVHVTVPEEEIEREHSRWINNSSILKGWGDISPEMCDNLLRKLSHS